VTRCSGVMMSVGGEATPKKGKGRDDASWANRILVGRKMKKIHVVDSADTNG
jgi:hypothetical protein